LMWRAPKYPQFITNITSLRRACCNYPSKGEQSWSQVATTTTKRFKNTLFERMVPMASYLGSIEDRSIGQLRAGITGSHARHGLGGPPMNPFMGARMPHPCGKRSGMATADTVFFI
jgi:hypothetical protein